MAQDDKTGRGPITRRGFLDRTGKLAAASLAAGALAEGFGWKASAQGTPAPLPPPAAPANGGKRPQRVALIGADHYHATSTPNTSRFSSVRVSTSSASTTGARICRQVGRAVQDSRLHRLPQDVRDDQAGFRRGAGASRCDACRIPLPRLGWRSLRDGKTMGHRRQDDQRTCRSGRVEEGLGRAADAVPLRSIRSDSDALEGSGPARNDFDALFRFNQPGIQRYYNLGSGWMLDKKEAGGGALINLGIPRIRSAAIHQR